MLLSKPNNKSLKLLSSNIEDGADNILHKSK